MAHKALVLAAGMGTRLRPLTGAVPKPLLPVWGVPMLERVVEWLRGQGVDDIVVNAHYLHGQIEDWCAANNCRCSCEPEILGTGGALNPLRDWIGNDEFWLVNGDIVFDGASFPSRPVATSAPLPLIGCCLVTEEGPRTIEIEPGQNLVTCWKSPDPGWSGTWTYCGVALLKPEILSYIPPTGFSTIVEAYEKAMMDGKFIQAVKCEELLWTDAGTVESYIAVNTSGDENAFASIPQIAKCLPDAKSGNVRFASLRGSDRLFFKADGEYIIIYDDAKRPENARYASHARWLKEHGIRVPAVLADFPELKTLAIEDAGSLDLREHSKMLGEDRLYDYIAAVEELARFNSLDASSLSLEPPFDAALYKWERELFAEQCLRGHFGMALPGAVEAELEQVAGRLLAEPPALVHRDFQSSNLIMVPSASGKNGGAAPVIIDFQGMRIGPAAYDLASLLYDPYVDLRDGERRALAALYAKKANRPDIAGVLPFAAVERLVQALGAYGRLTAAGNSEFARHILPALENLLAVADEAGLDATGALAEELIAKESTKREAARDGDCHCGHHHHHDHRHCEGTAS